MQQIIATFKSGTSREVLDKHIKVLLNNFDLNDDIEIYMSNFENFIEIRISKLCKTYLKLVKT